MCESYVFLEIQILLEGLGKMQIFNEATPVISFITHGLTYTVLNGITDLLIMRGLGVLAKKIRNKI